MKKALQVLSCLFLLAAVSCTKKAGSEGSAPVVIVDGENYSASAFAEDIGRKLKNFDALAAKDPTNVKRVKENALKEFIVSSLLEHYAKEHRLDVTSADVDAEVDRIRKTYPDDLTFKSGLASAGLTLEAWRQSLRRTLLEKKVFAALSAGDDTGGKANDKADNKDGMASQEVLKAQEYYNAHKAEFQHPAQVHLQQILLVKEDDADRLLRKIKADGHFSEMAKKFSISPDGANGGDLGFLSKGTVPAFDFAFNMKPGQMSGVVKSSYGFHIVKVLDKRPQGLIPFEQAKPMLLRRLAAERQQEIFKNWLDGAIKNAKVERNDDLINKIRIRTEGEQE